MPVRDKNAPIGIGDLNEINTDRSGDTPVMLRGIMMKTSGGSWVYALGNSDGAQIVNYEAAFTDVDTVFTSVTSGGTIYQMQDYYGGKTRQYDFGYDVNNNVSAISCTVS